MTTNNDTRDYDCTQSSTQPGSEGGPSSAPRRTPPGVGRPPKVLGLATWLLLCAAASGCLSSVHEDAAGEGADENGADPFADGAPGASDDPQSGELAGNDGSGTFGQDETLQPAEGFDDGVDGGGEGEPAEPFVRELATFVPNTTQWASLLVTTTGARVIGGQSETIAPSYANFLGSGTLEPRATYLQVDLELTNVGPEEVDFTERDTWDLVLADGTRVRSEDRLDVSILPGNTAATRTHYMVEPDVDLTGASIMLEGEDYGVLQPSTIPLDTELVRVFPRRIEAWVGTVFEDVQRRVEIDEAIWDENHEVLGRPVVGARSIWLRIAVTMPADNSDHWSGNDVRLSVNGRSSSPIEWEHGIVDKLETKVFLVAFELEAEATVAEVLVPLNTAAGSRKYGEALAIDLTTTTLAELPGL